MYVNDLYVSYFRQTLLRYARLMLSYVCSRLFVCDVGAPYERGGGRRAPSKNLS